MKKVFVMAVAIVLSGATVSMAQTKKPMRKKVDSTSMPMQDTSMMKNKPMKMKKKPMKPMKDSMSSPM